MFTDKNLRRDFLKLTGAGMAGAGLLRAGQGTAQTVGPGPTPGVSDVRAFGAVGDGKALDTPSINQAIDATAAAGGGTVRFPAGSYLCYTSAHK